MASLKNPGKSLTDWGFDVPGRLTLYRSFIDQTKEQIQSAKTGPVKFIDVHQWYQETHADHIDPGDGTHMWDNKQQWVGEYLVEQLAEQLCGRQAY
jgi:hypothetical protein